MSTIIFGEFRGSGVNRTVITNLPNLYVEPAYFFEYEPSADHPWPMLFIFVDGEFLIADLTFHIDDHGGDVTTGWSIFGLPPFCEFATGLTITGTRANAKVTRILLEGEPMTTSLLGYSLINGIYYEGVTGGLPHLPLSGSYSLSRSTFRNIGVASPLANLTDASVWIHHNTYDDVILAVDGQDFVNSSVEIASNKAESFIGVEFYNSSQPAHVNTSFVVRNNRFTSNYGVTFRQNFDADTTCLIKSNDFREILDTSVQLLGSGTDACIVKNNRE